MTPGNDPMIPKEPGIGASGGKPGSDWHRVYGVDARKVIKPVTANPLKLINMMELQH